MKKTLAALALTVVSLAGCTPATSPTQSTTAIVGFKSTTGKWQAESQTVDYGDRIETRYANGVVVSVAK